MASAGRPSRKGHKPATQPPELGSLEPWKLSRTPKGPKGRPGTSASLQHRTGLR